MVDIESFVRAQKINTDAMRAQVAELTDALADHRKHMDERMDRGAARMQALEGDIRSNTTATNELKASTSELMEWLSNFKGAFKTLNLVGKLAIPLGAILGLVTAIVGVKHWFGK